MRDVSLWLGQGDEFWTFQFFDPLWTKAPSPPSFFLYMLHQNFN